MSSETIESRMGWSLLKAESPADTELGVATLATDVVTGEGPVRFALGPNGEPRLLLPLRRGRRLPKFPETQALKIVLASFHQGGVPIRFLDLICLARDLDGVFSEVVDTILDRIRAGESPVDACNGTLRDFRALLVAGPKADVSAEIVAGLVGELVVLDRLLDRAPVAAGLWRGPLGERHDFRGATHALEVKTSRRISQTSVRISAIDQLLPPNDGTLHLVHLKLEAESGGALSVARLAEQVMGKACDPQEVAALLAELDCPDPAAPEWNRHAFRLEEEATYEVCDGFPRIIPKSLVSGMLPEGVVALDYEIDLAMAQAFRLAASDADNCFERLTECLSPS